jgi:hypothetical protein
MNEEKKAQYEAGGGNYHFMASCPLYPLHRYHKIYILFSSVNSNKP